MITDELLLKFREAAEIDHRLLALEDRVREMAVDGDDPSFWLRYSRWKRKLCTMVGWDATKPELRRSRTYEVCLDYLLDIYEGRA